MKNTVLVLLLLNLLSCMRTDMDLKTLQHIISKSSFTNKLSTNDDMVFYKLGGKRDTYFENYLRKNNVITMISGDFNHDGEEDYLTNVSNSFNRTSAVPSQYFPIIITIKNGKYFIYKLDQFYDAKSVDTFNFAHNNIMMLDKKTLK